VLGKHFNDPVGERALAADIAEWPVHE
jgi:hypothetical protein